MKWTNNLKRVLTGIVIFSAVLGHCQNPPPAANEGANVADQQTEAKSLVGKRGEQQVDLFTGSFGYSIPIACAPARNGSEPALALTYSSGGENGWCGMGWKLDIGYIQRNTKDGFPIQFSTANPPAPLAAYDDSKGFLLNLFGKEIKILPVGNNEYRPEVDTDFLRCVLDTSDVSNPKWLVYDKSGTVYYFGRTSSSRVINSKTGWSGSSATFYWALDQIITATGDQTTIAYTTYGTEKTIYPTTITYNGHTGAAFTGLHTISFDTENRPDKRVSYRWGFRTEQNRRLTNIVCKVNSILVRRYALNDYSTSAATKRSLLKSVTVYGSDNTAKLPTQVFTYQGNTTPVSFGPTINWTNVNLNTPGSPSGSYLPFLTQVNQPSGVTIADLFDIDGDGLPDRICWDQSGSPRKYQVQRNLGLQANGNGKFDTRYAFGPSSTGSGSTPSDTNPMPDDDAAANGSWSALNSPRVRVRDINGDGLPDRIGDYWKNFDATFGAGTSYTNFEVMTNSGKGFVGIGDALQPYAWPLSAGQVGVYDTYKINSAVEDGTFVGLFDINGDGLPDRVISQNYTVGANGPGGNYQVQFNTGTGFTAPKLFGPYKSQNYPGGYLLPFSGLETPNVHMMDINGDGLPDRVMLAMSSSNPGNPVAYPYVNYFSVEYNNGYGFEAVNTSATQPGAYADQWPGVDSQTSYNLGLSLYQIQISPYVVMFDLNGDGLPDRVMLDASTISSATPKWLVCLNNGHGFDAGIQVGNIENQGQVTQQGYWPNWFSMQGSANGSGITTLMDMNGDGLPDRVMKVYDNGMNNADSKSNYFLVQLNQGPYPDLLIGINNGIGGTIGVAYKSSTVWDNTKDPTHPEYGSQLPFPMQTVATVTTSDGINASRTTKYDYAGGFFDGNRREFAGFAVVTNTEPLAMGATVGRKTISYFHQGGGRDYVLLGEYADAGNFAKRGMPYRIETYGNESTPVLYKMVINQVDQISLNSNGSYPNRYFPFVSQMFEYDYPAGAASTPKITGSKFVYSTATGTAAADNLTERLTQKVLWGEVSGVSLTTIATPTTDVVPADTQYHQIHYATITGNANIIDHPDIVSLTSDAAGSTVVQQTKYTYNGTSGTVLTEQTRICLGPPAQYAVKTYNNYNTYGLADTITDEKGVQTYITYDDTHHMYPATTRLRVAPDVNTSDSGGANNGDHVITTTYDARSGLLLTAQDLMKINLLNTYDVFFRLTKMEKGVTPNGLATALWVKQVSYALGGISGSASGNYVHVKINDGVDATDGNQTRIYTDGFGRVIQTVTEAEQAGYYRRVNTAYDERGIAFLTTWPQLNQVGFNTTHSIPNGTFPATFTDFDPAGRVKLVQPRVEAVFSANGIYQSKTDNVGDGASSPLAARNIAYTYDDGTGANPWWLVITDEDQRVRRYKLDGFGRTNLIQEVADTATYTTTLKYDLPGNLTEIIDSATPTANHIYYGYDDAGRMVALADPHMGQWTYELDAAGRLRQQTDAKGQKIILTYGATLGRLSTKQVKNAANAVVSTTTYTYDTSDDTANYPAYKGLLYKEVTDSTGTDNDNVEINGYDSRGRLWKNLQQLGVNGQSYLTTYGYNDGDKVTSIAYPKAGPTIQYEYHPSGALRRVFRSTPSAYDFYIADTGTGNANFDEFGHTLTFKYGNNKTTTRAYYDNSKRLKTISCPGILSKSYQYTAGSDVKDISGTAITYDYLHRVKTYAGLANSYLYDSVGNITTSIEGGGSAYTYGVRRTEAVKSAFSKTSLYDLCGNMIVRHGAATGSQALDYDAENHLTRFSQVGATIPIVEFGYAADGARLWKRMNQNPAQLQVWIGNIYEEKGGKTLFHVYAGDQQVCTFEPTSPLAIGGSANAVGYYYHQDHLNSSSALSDKDGNQLELNIWYPFGSVQTASPQASFQVSRQFTGQIMDDETGLYYYNFRYYDPELGRFIQPDDRIPDLGNPQSYNRYSYVMNNPLRYNDPSGHYGVSDWWSDTKTGAGMIGSWASSAGHAAGNFFTGSDNKQMPSPNSIQALGQQEGVWFQELSDGNGKKLGNVATAPVKAGANALFQAGTMMTPMGEEKALAGITEKVGANLLKNITRAINLPGWKKVTVDMAHIAERHMDGGKLTAGRDVFVGLNEKGVMAAIKQAYGSATTIAVQNERVLLSGTTKTGMTVEMWLNKTTKIIETAYPVTKK